MSDRDWPTIHRSENGHVGRFFAIRCARCREQDFVTAPPGAVSTHPTIAQKFRRAGWTIGATEHHYQTMAIEDIMALPVGSVAADDAALFLWVYQPMLPQALDVIAAWGFDFKTVAYVWVKLTGPEGQGRLFVAPEDLRKGLGYHTRAGTEQVWLATRGRGYERLSKSEPQAIMAGLREHSRKPDEIRTSIERLVGDVPRLELFARTAAPGWAAWGNETMKFGVTA